MAGVMTQQQQITATVRFVALGDSFTEGIGLPYEETFVGRIAAALPGKRVANLAVVPMVEPTWVKVRRPASRAASISVRRASISAGENLRIFSPYAMFSYTDICGYSA